jgi:hypothetical protein
MRKPIKLYFAGRCLAKMAALECLHWNNWDHQLHLKLMKQVRRVLFTHEELSSFMDNVQTYIENPSMPLSEVLTDFDHGEVPKDTFKIFRDGVQDELMNVRSYQREVLGQVNEEPEPVTA